MSVDGVNYAQGDFEKYQLLKKENKKLMHMLENSEKMMKFKLKESRSQIDKIMGIINKVWKILQKQILSSQMRRQYFEKNSPEELELKKLLKENEQLRSNSESRFQMLDNLGAILDIWSSKLSMKQESDVLMMKKNCKLKNELKLAQDREVILNKKIEEWDKQSHKFQVTINEMNNRIDELEALKMTFLDKTIHQLAEQEELFINSQSLINPKTQMDTVQKIKESSELPTFGWISLKPEAMNDAGDQHKITVTPSEIWRDVNLVPGYLRALTNEIVYLYDELDNSSREWVISPFKNRSMWKKIRIGFKQITPKQPHSPAFYTSSEFMDSASFQIISSKKSSSNNSQKFKEKSGETSTASEVENSRPTNQTTIEYKENLSRNSNWKMKNIDFYNREMVNPSTS
jgi:hypothetical protein